MSFVGGRVGTRVNATGVAVVIGTVDVWVVLATMGAAEVVTDSTGAITIRGGVTPRVGLGGPIAVTGAGVNEETGARARFDGVKVPPAVVGIDVDVVIVGAGVIPGTRDGVESVGTGTEVGEAGASQNPGFASDISHALVMIQSSKSLIRV